MRQDLDHLGGSDRPEEIGVYISEIPGLRAKASVIRKAYEVSPAVTIVLSIRKSFRVTKQASVYDPMPRRAGDEICKGAK
jgi:hypothetical protein